MPGSAVHLTSRFVRW